MLAVVEILDCHPNIGPLGLTRSIHCVMRAMRDTQKGGRPPLFFDRPRKAGRPSEQSDEAIHGAAGAYLQLLMDCGISLTEASETVARLLNSRHVLPKIVKAATVKRWRNEMGGEPGRLSNKMYRDILEKSREPGSKVRSRGEMLAYVEGSLRAIKATGF